MAANIYPQLTYDRVEAEAHSNMRSSELERVRGMTGGGLQELWLKVEISAYGYKELAPKQMLYLAYIYATTSNII